MTKPKEDHPEPEGYGEYDDGERHLCFFGKLAWLLIAAVRQRSLVFFDCRERRVSMLTSLLRIANIGSLTAI